MNTVEKENRALKQSHEKLINNFHKLSSKILHSGSLEDNLEAIFEVCQEIFPYEEIAVYLMKNTFELIKYKNLSDESYMEVSQIQEDNIFDWVILQNKKITLERKYKKGSYVFLPLIMKNRSLGIMLIGTDKEVSNITKEENDILDIISSNVTVSIENSKLYSTLDEQKKKLDNIKNYLSNVIENFNEGLIVVDTDYIVTTINCAAENFLKISRKEIMLKNIRLFYNNWFTPEFFEKISESIFQKKITHYMVDVRQVFLKFTIIPFKGNRNIISGAIIHIEDVTTGMELEKLKEIDDYKNQVISNISHELKTPLTSIKAYTETLTEIIESDSEKYEVEFKDFLNVIYDESERLLNLIMEILDTSKLESGRVNLNLSLFDLNTVIRKIIKGIDYLLKEKNIKVNIDFKQEETFNIEADLIKLEQVFYNVLSNAVKYNEQNGKINIKIKRLKEVYKIIVEDTGIGIDNKSIEKIFEKFYRESNVDTENISGFGLGLSIVKNIIDLHNGDINIKSKKGKGTKIILKIPYEQKSI
ncbi:MAG: ATP-binding protein [Candidatus Muiribacteriota bacterium]